MADGVVMIMLNVIESLVKNVKKKQLLVIVGLRNEN